MRSYLVDMTPLRESPDYRRLWVGGALSSMGSNLTSIVVALQVYELTQSTLSVGLVGLAAFVPLVVLGLYGGSIVDAYDRRRVLITTQLGLVAVGIALAVLAATGKASVPALYALVAVQSGFFAVHSPARSAVIPRLLPISLLPSANALSTLSMGVSLAVGPVIGGVLVDVAGYQWAYSVEVLLMAGAVSMIFSLPPLPPLGEARRAGLRSVVEGLAFLRRRPTLGMTFVADLFAMVLAMPRVLFPAVAATAIGGGATTVGILVGGIAAGTLLGGVFSGRLGRINHQGVAIVAAVACWGVFVTLFGVVVLTSPGPLPDGSANWALWPATGLLALAGAADTVSAVFRSTVLQVSTPDALRGRLQGVFTLVVAGGPQLGSVVLGAVAAGTGEGAAAIIGGLACMFLVVLTARLQRGLLAYRADAISDDLDETAWRADRDG